MAARPSNINLPPASATDITGAYVFKQAYVEEFDFSTQNDPANASSLSYWKLLSPSKSPDGFAYLKDYMSRLEQAFNGTPATATYDKFFDETALADYFISQELSLNVDGYSKSNHFTKPKTVGTNERLVMGPVWDFDMAYGAQPLCSPNNASQKWRIQLEPLGLSFHVRAWNTPAFRVAFLNRYTSLRASAKISRGASDKKIDALSARIAAAKSRDHLRWGQPSTPRLISGLPPSECFNRATVQKEVTEFKNFVRGRIDFMDARTAAPGFREATIDQVFYNGAVVKP